MLKNMAETVTLRTTAMMAETLTLRRTAMILKGACRPSLARERVARDSAKMWSTGGVEEESEMGMVMVC